MEKYLFTVNVDTMSANGKGQSDLENMVKTAMPRYGTVEPFIEADYADCNEVCACDGAERAQELQAEADRLTAMCADYAKYDPLIEFVKAMNAEQLSLIESLTNRAETAEADAAELSKFKELIEVAKKLKE